MTARPHRRPQRTPLTDRLAEALALGAFGAGPSFADIAQGIALGLDRYRRRRSTDLRPA